MFLPLSADGVLVGTPTTSCPELDVSSLNKAIVRCSDEFFVSATALQADSTLPKSIGKWSGILNEHEMNTIVRGLTAASLRP